MRQVNGDRRRRALLLSKQLEELAVARRQLVVQLEELDAKARSVQTEINSLQNQDAPISNLPDEVLAMIFEAGSLLPQESHGHFGSLVSHIIKRWRYIALSTPRLWNKIYCTRPEGMHYEISYWEEGRQRAAAFLARSRSFPVEINIQGFVTEEDFSQEFIQLIWDHIGHCRHLSITLTSPLALLKALEHLSRQAVPVLSSIELTIHDTFNDGSFELDGHFFPLGAPHLTTVQLHMIDPSSLPFCLPAFTHVASLQLTGIWVEDDGYWSLRDTLMALQALDHLELQLDCFDTMNPRLPMVLPNMRLLRIEGNGINVHLDDAIHSIHAESLNTLLINGWDRGIPELDLFSEEELEYSHCFPSLQHLILLNISPYASDLRCAARRFPGIARLTCHARALPYQPTSDIYNCFLNQIAPRPPYSDLEEEEENGGDGNIATSSHHKWWPKLHTVAMSAFNDTQPLAIFDLHLEVSRLQKAGHLIRALKLPHDVCLRASAQAMARLRKIVEVEDFSMDWPTPFEKFI